MSLERQYAKQLNGYVKRKFAVIKDHQQEIIDLVQLYSVNLDDAELMEESSTRIDILLDQIERDMEPADSLTRAMNNMADAIERYNKAEFDAIMKSILGFPLRVPLAQLSRTDERMDATLDEDIATLKMTWVRQNLALIKSIDSQTMQKIEDKMMERIIETHDARLLNKYLIQDIQDIADVELNRATLIGVDLVGKLNGRMTQ
ncbi:hypothetical protein, partial [uncultured Megasphaera sp.]|uniref:hypothetical protein n=1 Tax=uncultured Megasphaera sp. TaxID=165188 RepID=UPI00265AAE62